MAVNPSLILRVPGVLSFAGVSLGPIKEAFFLPNIRYGAITAEEFGNLPVEYFNLGAMGVFVATLRSYSSTNFDAIFPSNTSQNSDDAGKTLDNETGVLLFTPDASSHPGIRFFKAQPLIAEQARVAFSWGEEFGLPVAFTAVPDSSGAIYDIGVGV